MKKGKKSETGDRPFSLTNLDNIKVIMNLK